MAEIRSKKRVLVFSAIGGAAVLLFFMFGQPQFLAKSNSPDFCGGCHTMEAEYEAWNHTGAHRRKLCVDCHLPNENPAVHYVWKGIDGMKDVLAFYSGMVPERIRLTGRGENVVQQNCIRCHEQTVMRVNPDRKCWECHRRIAHTLSGAMQTL